MTDADLTGRARARPGWFGRLTLQVELRTTIRGSRWRNARWDDLCKGELVLRNWGHEPPRPLPAGVAFPLMPHSRDGGGE